MALRKYRDFMDETARARAILEEAAIGVDMYIEGEIERMRLREITSREE